VNTRSSLASLAALAAFAAPAALLAPAAFAQPKPGAAPDVLTNASAVYSVPATGEPTYLKSMTDPTFGSTLVRIAGNPSASTSPVSGTWGSDTRHHYSKDEPWSADGAFYFIENRGGSPTDLVLDGHTFAPLFGVPSSAGLYDFRWHPAKAHAHEMINVNSSGTELAWVDAPTGHKTRTWTLPFAVSGYGSGEGNASHDGRFIALASGSQMVVVDMDPQPPFAAYPSKRIGPARTISDCGLSSCAIDWVSVSSSGRYAVVSYDGDYPRVYDIDANTLALTPHVYASGTQACGRDPAKGYILGLGHADFALDPFDGSADVLIGQRRSSCPSMGGVVKVRLRDGAVTALTDPTNEAFPHHISMRSADRPGWAYVGYYEEAGKRFSDELVAVKIDGSKAVERYVHMHSAVSGCYRCEEHAVPSLDGSMIAFASNWATDCGSGCGSSSVIKDYVVTTGVVTTDASGPPRPAAAAVALARIWPNPSNLPLHVTFALPESGPATLELVDVAGRSVIAQALGSPGAGLYDATFGAGASLRPGTYWLRLSQGSGRAASRVVILE
jgi:hypothetical protein